MGEGILWLRSKQALQWPRKPSLIKLIHVSALLHKVTSTVMARVGLKTKAIRITCSFVRAHNIFVNFFEK